MKLYKLTDKDRYTRRNELNKCRWGKGITHTAKSKDRTLCTDGLIHGYLSPEIAAIMYRIHIPDIKRPVCWEARGRILREDGVKIGCKSMTTLHRVPLPTINKLQRINVAIKTILQEKQRLPRVWAAWAKKWLSGKDRTWNSANKSYISVPHEYRYLIFEDVSRLARIFTNSHDPTVNGYGRTYIREHIYVEVACILYNLGCESRDKRKFAMELTKTIREELGR